MTLHVCMQALLKRILARVSALSHKDKTPIYDCEVGERLLRTCTEQDRDLQARIDLIRGSKGGIKKILHEGSTFHTKLHGCDPQLLLLCARARYNKAKYSKV